jgi:hypothetical protein
MKLGLRESIYILFQTTVQPSTGSISLPCIERLSVGLRLCFVKNWIALLSNLANDRGTGVDDSPRRIIHASE